MTVENLDNDGGGEYVADEGDNSSQSTEVEAQATSLGWKPLEDYKGDPDKWADAETFLQVHSRNNGALKDANKRQAAEMAALRRQMEGLTVAHQKMFEMQVKKMSEEHQQQLNFLKAQKRNALTEGDHVTASDIDEQIDTLKAAGPEIPDVPVVESKKANDAEAWMQLPEVIDFTERNPWINTDEDMATYAVAKGAQIRKSSPGLDNTEFLAQVEQATRKAFPHKFQTRRQPVEGGQRGGEGGISSGGKGTYAAMPKEAREACDEFVSDKTGTRDEYVKMYFDYDNKRKGS